MEAQSKQGWPTLVKRTAISFLRDDCEEHAAALAYYAVFSLPPLLLVTVGLFGAVMDRSTIVGTIYTEIAINARRERRSVGGRGPGSSTTIARPRIPSRCPRDCGLALFRDWGL